MGSATSRPSRLPNGQVGLSRSRLLRSHPPSPPKPARRDRCTDRGGTAGDAPCPPSPLRAPAPTTRPAPTSEGTATMLEPMTIATPSELASARPAPADPAWIRPWLRAEGIAVLAAGGAGFLFLGLPWWAFLLLLFVPDVSMLGYVRGPRVGAITYNVAHDLFTGVAIAGVGVAIGSVPIAAIGAVLVAHSGMDRMMGYGLKLPTSFKDTHLGRIGRE